MPESELSMMTRPAQWPYWPFLPLKRQTAGGGWPEVGVLMVNNGEYLFVAGKGLFEDLHLDDFEAADPEKLVAQGWVVD